MCNNDFFNERSANHELDVSNYVRSADPTHPGYESLRTPFNSFSVEGPHGKHLCLVYEPLREPIWLLQRRFPNSRYPSTLLKLTVVYILEALDYLHSVCHVIHTGTLRALRIAVI